MFSLSDTAITFWGPYEQYSDRCVIHIARRSKISLDRRTMEVRRKYYEKIILINTDSYFLIRYDLLPVFII